MVALTLPFLGGMGGKNTKWKRRCHAYRVSFIQRELLQLQIGDFFLLVPRVTIIYIESTVVSVTCSGKIMLIMLKKTATEKK